MELEQRVDYFKMSVDELCEHLKKVEGIQEDILSVLHANKINGANFLELNAELLKELFPVVGERLMVARTIRKCTQEVEPNPTRSVEQVKNLKFLRFF